MKLKTMLGVAAASLGLMAAALVPAVAAGGPFATFSQVGTTSTPFTFKNTGSTSTFTVTGSIPVNFTYFVANAYNSGTATPVGSTIAATMTFSAIVNAPAFNFGGIDVQGLNLTSEVFTANTPVGGLTNLLTVSGNGILFGLQGGSIPTFGGDTTLGNTVNMSSDFLTFAGNKSFNLEYTMKNGQSLGIAANQYLKNFKAAGTGTFSSQFVSNPVPEPGAPVAFLIGGLGVLGLIAFGRKTRAGSLAS